MSEQQTWKGWIYTKNKNNRGRGEGRRGEWKALNRSQEKKRKGKKELKKVKVKVKIMSMMVNNTIRPVHFQSPSPGSTPLSIIRSRRREEKQQEKQAHITKTRIKGKKDRIMEQERAREKERT